jgi:hypothetical protein
LWAFDSSRCISGASKMKVETILSVESLLEFFFYY